MKEQLEKAKDQGVKTINSKTNKQKTQTKTWSPVNTVLNADYQESQKMLLLGQGEGTEGEGACQQPHDLN